jgi:hypothetical protein
MLVSAHTVGLSLKQRETLSSFGSARRASSGTSRTARIAVHAGPICELAEMSIVANMDGIRNIRRRGSEVMKGKVVFVRLQ